MREIFEPLLDTIPAEMIRDLEIEFRRGWHQEAVQSQITQRRMESENRADHCAVNGIGRLRMRVDGTAFHYWGQRVGYGCWKDEQFLKEFERDNPEARVRCGGTRMQVGYSPQKKFSKTYESNTNPR